MIGAATKDARGTILAGRYELVREIASGGMATVWLARARAVGGFERRVAIKCCHPHLRSDAEFVAMFLDEARLAARIHHPNVVATVDVVDDPAALFLVMDYVEGATLQQLVREEYEQHRAVPVDVALRVVVDALEGLHAAHILADDAGNPLRIVHRDVSPHNVLVGSDGIARIGDFGVAKAEARATVTRKGEVKGKLGYMSPEQLQSKALDARADVFSMGIVLWETLVGARLFRGETDVDTATMILQGRIDRPSQRSEALPRALDEVVMRALDRDRDRRFESAAAMSAAIEATGLPIATPRRITAYLRELAVVQPPASEAKTAIVPLPPDVATQATSPTAAEIAERSDPGSPTKNRSRLAAVLGAGVVLAAVGAWAALSSRTTHEPSTAATTPPPSSTDVTTGHQAPTATTAASTTAVTSVEAPATASVPPPKSASAKPGKPRPKLAPPPKDLGEFHPSAL